MSPTPRRAAGDKPSSVRGEATIDPDTLKTRIEAACREVGVAPAVAARIVEGALGSGRLRAEIEEARADRDRLALLEGDVRRLLGPSRDKVLHDLRNVLNRLALLQEITGEGR